MQCKSVGMLLALGRLLSLLVRRHGAGLKNPLLQKKSDAPRVSCGELLPEKMGGLMNANRTVAAAIHVMII